MAVSEATVLATDFEPQERALLVTHQSNTCVSTSRRHPQHSRTRTNSIGQCFTKHSRATEIVTSRDGEDAETTRSTDQQQKKLDLDALPK